MESRLDVDVREPGLSVRPEDGQDFLQRRATEIDRVDG
jgi:hypothetical protein